MKKHLLFLAAPLLISYYSHAQATNYKDYKVVFDMTSRDTVNQAALVRELNLIMDANPEARLEVVLYGQGLDLVIKDRSGQQPAIQKLIADKRASFKACGAAMKRQHIEPGQLLSGVEMVPDGIYEIVSRQREGWGYIKVAH